MNEINSSIGISGTIEKWEVVNEDESIARACYRPSSNMITNDGLDLFSTGDSNAGTYAWWVTRYFCIGDGTTPASETDTSLDHELYRGTYSYISWDGTISPLAGRDPYIFVFKRGVEFTQPGTFTEIGFYPGQSYGSVDTRLFSRFLLVDNEGIPTSVTITTGQKLRLLYVVTINIGELTPHTGTVDITGLGPLGYTAGWQNIPTHEFVMAFISKSPANNNWHYNWVVATDKTYNFTTIGNQGTWGGTHQNQSYSFGKIPASPAYVNGSHCVYYDVTVPLGAINWTYGVKTIYFTYGDWLGPSANYAWVVVFDSPIMVTINHSLTMRFKFSWDRA
jgi:hypothetical protein